MKTENIPSLIYIDNFVINFNSISYFQYGYDQNSTQYFIKFKMICGDAVNFDFKNQTDYQEIVDILVKKTPKNVEKSVKNPSKKLKILQKNEEK